jgi:hypothetical protein
MLGHQSEENSDVVNLDPIVTAAQVTRVGMLTVLSRNEFF